MISAIRHIQAQLQMSVTDVQRFKTIHLNPGEWMITQFCYLILVTNTVKTRDIIEKG